MFNLTNQIIMSVKAGLKFACLGFGISRRREKRSARRGECWLEREEGEWESFPPPKIFHLSQRMNPRLAPDSPLYLMGGLGGHENRGYQR